MIWYEIWDDTYDLFYHVQVEKRGLGFAENKEFHSKSAVAVHFPIQRQKVSPKYERKTFLEIGH